MNVLQIWLQNHNRKMTQDAIDEALMEYISHVEKQRDELLAAIDYAIKQVPELGTVPGIAAAIASVKGETK